MVVRKVVDRGIEVGDRAQCRSLAESPQDGAPITLGLAAAEFVAEARVAGLGTVQQELIDVELGQQCQPGTAGDEERGALGVGLRSLCNAWI